MNRLPLLLFVALVLGAGQAQAQAQTGWLDRFNRAMGSANAALAEGVSDLAAAIPWRNPLPPEWAGYGGNLLANTLHEPVTALSYAAMLDGDRAMLSLRRFGINLMLGYGGLVDRATEQGVVVARADPGLALCAWGVPAGPYVVLPLLGGRSLRDGLAEIAPPSRASWSPAPTRGWRFVPGACPPAPMWCCRCWAAAACATAWPRSRSAAA